MAIMDRCATWRSHPILAAAQRYLTETALGRWIDYQSINWTAYRLKDHPLFQSVADLASNASAGPAKFPEFSVAVDSVRLADFRTKMARRLKSHCPSGSSSVDGSPTL